jgi:hypothetical protein
MVIYIYTSVRELAVEQVEAERFSCEACGKTYRWKEELAGRRVKCKCGHVMTAPQTPPTPPDDLYEMAPEPEKPRPMRPATMAAPAAAASLRPAKSSSVLQYRTPPKADRNTAAVIEAQPIKNLYAPIALVVIGTIIEFALVMAGTQNRLIGFAAAAMIVGVLMVLNVTTMLIGILIAAKIGDMGFGHPLHALLKLSAIAISVPAIYDLFSYITHVSYVGWVLSLIAYWTLFMWLFSLEWTEARIVVIIIWVLNIAKAALLIGLVMHFLHL